MQFRCMLNEFIHFTGVKCKCVKVYRVDVVVPWIWDALVAGELSQFTSDNSLLEEYNFSY